MPIIAPSLLSANFLRLEEDCQMLNESEADWFHLDVMDGRFVPNISFGMSIIKQIRKTTTKICDVHLMILEPEKYAEEFKGAGADILTVHYEACPHLHRNIQQIKSFGMQAGVAAKGSLFWSFNFFCMKRMPIVCQVNCGPDETGFKTIEIKYKRRM